MFIAALQSIDGKNPNVHFQMNKQNVVYTYNEIALSLKEMGNSDTCYEDEHLGLYVK